MTKFIHWIWISIVLAFLCPHIACLCIFASITSLFFSLSVFHNVCVLLAQLLHSNGTHAQPHIHTQALIFSFICLFDSNLAIYTYVWSEFELSAVNEYVCNCVFVFVVIFFFNLMSNIRSSFTYGLVNMSFRQKKKEVSNQSTNQTNREEEEKNNRLHTLFIRCEMF